MSYRVSRRLLIGSLLATAATGACANAPERSLRPPARPLHGRAQTAPDAEALIAEAKLGGKVSYLVADARTGKLLEGRNVREPMAPASTAKTFTTLFAFDRLGQGYRFRTRLVADGKLSGSRLDGDLVLVGGGDPTLDTEALAGMARALRAKGITEVTGRLRYWGGALPYQHEITPGQPDHLGYNPAISGLNLNFNRVYFEWKKKGNGYAVSMDARSDKRRPLISTSRMKVANRRSPLYTFKDGRDAEIWTVAKPALGKGGGRWLPVRHPDRYAAEVLRVLAGAEGISIAGGLAAAARAPAGAVLAERQSDDLRSIARGMLKYSTNMTAEVLGLSASGQPSLRASASEMDSWLGASYGAAGARLVDHSGLGGASRVTVEDMVSVLTAAGPAGPLRPILKDIPMRDAKGRPIANHPIAVQAKTGTLNFVSCLAGYAGLPGGRVLSFAILTGDLKRRASLHDEEQERPPGARAWNARAKHLQQALIERWGQVHGA
ncbi:D-alanyl-D-alanine carboxypeptidase/D-alanyl-D-alanine endopeptidase [Frigidibacter sp. ROC022]|uniref:D-alanyl-D-alanine carboxypeptidase/D-alanyl-D-alanine endopeptidase n=1 Tax=Frigidibacter sp. ROC022 TaxID=2971796 RepID=UPI00215AB605|nr:D-alanyl-D-alanine carboxypeptidase/D-alanyl-D-alanine-endopeptidase [Frigidibacter sp. ROC022]MCR8725842.1 D-alanyl-D-alanine carboxypeptidase/D-alanyl-D-alanine-endopeptidase [Frigidibacter sp. ROC022]